MTRYPIVTEDLEAVIAAPLPWGALAGRTVLVMGAAGFLPAYMVETLLFLNERRSQQRTRVLGLVRHEGRARERFAAHAGRPGLQRGCPEISKARARGWKPHAVIAGSFRRTILSFSDL